MTQFKIALIQFINKITNLNLAQATKAPQESRGMALLSLTSALDGSDGEGDCV